MRTFFTLVVGAILGAGGMFWALSSGAISKWQAGQQTQATVDGSATPAPGDYAGRLGTDARRGESFNPTREVKPGSPEPPAVGGVVSAATRPDPTDKNADFPQVKTDEQYLAERKLGLPIRDYPREQLHDGFNEKRDGSRPHEAVDMLAPRGTPVLAVDDGRVAKLFTSKQGGLTVYLFDPTITYSYYFAHLDRYADKLAEGSPVRRGDIIGYVGTTGNAAQNTPHLHFAIFRLGPDRNWWQGTPVNPYPVLLSLNR